MKNWRRLGLVLGFALALGACGGGGGGGGGGAPPAPTTGTWDASTWDNANWSA